MSKHKSGIYETFYGNAVSLNGEVAHDLDMNEDIPVEFVDFSKFIRKEED